jgi:D-glucosaminate-6-phosphate ammonia-lyase
VDPAERTARWTARLEAVARAAAPLPLRLVPDGAKPGLPLLEWRLPDAAAARRAEAWLRARDPAIHLDASRIRHGILAVNPIALADEDAALLGGALAGCGA